MTPPSTAPFIQDPKLEEIIVNPTPNQITQLADACKKVDSEILVFRDRKQKLEKLMETVNNQLELLISQQAKVHMLLDQFKNRKLIVLDTCQLNSTEKTKFSSVEESKPNLDLKPTVLAEELDTTPSNQNNNEVTVIVQQSLTTSSPIDKVSRAQNLKPMNQIPTKVHYWTFADHEITELLQEIETTANLSKYEAVETRASTIGHQKTDHKIKKYKKQLKGVPNYPDGFLLEEIEGVSETEESGVMNPTPGDKTEELNLTSMAHVLSFTPKRSVSSNSKNSTMSQGNDGSNKNLNNSNSKPMDSSVILPKFDEKKLLKGKKLDLVKTVKIKLPEYENLPSTLEKFSKIQKKWNDRPKMNQFCSDRVSKLAKPLTRNGLPDIGFRFKQIQASTSNACVNENKMRSYTISLQSTRSKSLPPKSDIEEFRKSMKVQPSSTMVKSKLNPSLPIIRSVDVTQQQSNKNLNGKNKQKILENETSSSEIKVKSTRKSNKFGKSLGKVNEPKKKYFLQVGEPSTENLYTFNSILNFEKSLTSIKPNFKLANPEESPTSNELLQKATKKLMDRQKRHQKIQFSMKNDVTNPNQDEVRQMKKSMSDNSGWQQNLIETSRHFHHVKRMEKVKENSTIDLSIKYGNFPKIIDKLANQNQENEIIGSNSKAYRTISSSSVASQTSFVPAFSRPQTTFLPQKLEKNYKISQTNNFPIIPTLINPNNGRGSSVGNWNGNSKKQSTTLLALPRMSDFTTMAATVLDSSTTISPIIENKTKKNLDQNLSS